MKLLIANGHLIDPTENQNSAKILDFKGLKFILISQTDYEISPTFQIFLRLPISR